MTGPTFGTVPLDALGSFTDLYELSMMGGYVESGHDPTATFSLFFRDLPPDRGYVVAAGLEQVVAYIQELSVPLRVREYLAEQGFSETFLDELADFSFSGEVRAVPEGTVVFPDEPLLEVTAPIFEAQLFETLVLNQVGFQSLVATKAARMCHAVESRGGDQTLVDFGSRRAHGTDAGVKAARAAAIGGFDGTSNVAAGSLFDLPVFGTMAHSWVQSFPTERAAFEAFVAVYGSESVLLVDTYDTVGGVETALAVAEEMDADVRGVRLDSGDLVALSKATAERVGDRDIFVSSGIDEYEIADFLDAGGVATGFGPGTALTTSEGAPALDIVYKLVAVEREGRLQPSMKLSTGKVSEPGQKALRRVEQEGQFQRDVLARRDEDTAGEDLLVDVFREGELVYELPALDEIRARTRRQRQRLPEGVQRLSDPATYPVDHSDGLRTLREDLRADLEAQYRPRD